MMQFPPNHSTLSHSRAHPPPSLCLLKPPADKPLVWMAKEAPACSGCGAASLACSEVCTTDVVICTASFSGLALGLPSMPELFLDGWEGVSSARLEVDPPECSGLSLRGERMGMLSISEWRFVGGGDSFSSSSLDNGLSVGLSREES